MRFARAGIVACAIGVASAAPRTAAACPDHIRFAGFDWVVSDAAEPFPGAASGFQWNACNVEVRSLRGGGEILTLTLRKEASGWRGAQLATREQYQYGTFSMNVDNALRPMLSASPSAVLGFFAYSGPAYTNEIDVEFTRWGATRSPPMHYTVWPATDLGVTPPSSSSSAGGTLSQFAEPALHRFVWTEGRVLFQSFSGAGSAPIGRPFRVTTNVPTSPMHIMLNFWIEPHANMGGATAYEVRITSVTRTLP